ncbi:calcitonin gene-related peptide type 1 receptor-like isoform X2 [Lineus longissimus]|uniref:calcitonin gene-related peptide type 1 receptor-like isoform X2 n=1 Tax=Lineus longissimus TaxID=88925 RepID=UPI00315DD928
MQNYSRITLFLFVQISAILTATGGTQMNCRIRGGIRPPDAIYNAFTCTSCWAYIFQTSKQLYQNSVQLVARNGSTLFPSTTTILPDIKNNTQKEYICRALSEDECSRWSKCCWDAIDCCQWQKENEVEMTTNTGKECPATWDGFACWEHAAAGSTTYKDCPSFLPFVTPGVKGQKICTENATWWRHEDNDKEFTDYGNCLDLDMQLKAVIISIACYLISVVALIPAIVIFIYYKTLLLQHRIRLHLNLFLSFLLNSICLVIWNFVIVYDKLTVPLTESVLYGNSAGCKLLSTLTRYFEDTCFVWMFCEGFFLHQLLNNTFRPQQSILGYYVFGWAFALLPTIVYAIIRGVLFNGDCWMKNIGNYEWIHYVPNLAAIVLNLIFLINILRILLTQLQSHPNEPSNYRRALKATFILVPLFGLQWLLTIYRPSPDTRAYIVIDIAHRVLSGLQGLFVALIFCYFNGEVVQQLKRTCPCLTRLTSGERHASMSTQYTYDGTSKSEAATTTHHVTSTARHDVVAPASPGNGAVQPDGEGNYIQLAQMENGKKM